ncbi:MAG: 2-oxoacid:acceptor oxidoreductase family protein [bacterium]|nr:2-oxoacid:acceptor oxidoreductase family protein [bacterium]
MAGIHSHHGVKMTVVRFAGSGGQGLMTSGRILAQAAGLYGGRTVLQTQSYGPEARGGAAKSEVCIADAPIDNLKPTRIDVLVAMNQASCDKHSGDLKPDGILVADSSFVDKPPREDAFSFPFTFHCRDTLGNPVVANIMSLGYILVLTEVTSRQALTRALTDNVPQRFLELNLRAFEEGEREGEKARAARAGREGF